jgi:non-homologous end joining protein Ku
VDSADIIKGYEVGKGDYRELDPEELEAVAIESKRTNEFVPKDEIDEIYLNNPLLHCPRRRGWSAGIRCYSGSDPQGGYGGDWQGRVHLA